MAESQLSKLDVNLQSLNPYTFSKTRCIVNLHISDDTKNRDPSTTNGSYSNSQLLSNGEHVCYHFSQDYCVLSIYPVTDAITGKTVVVHLPHETFNDHHTFTMAEEDGCIVMDLILKTGLFLTLRFSLEYLFNRNADINSSWYSLLKPYDFTVRLPDYLYKVNSALSIVYLNDGGLLGLQKTQTSGSDEYDLHPVLFNDNSYFQSFTRFFSHNDSGRENVVSSVSYGDYHLLTLTENCKLRIWDLRTNSVTAQLNLITDPQDKHRKYESIGPYLALLDSVLVVFLPFGNGAFRTFQLSVNNSGGLVLTPRGELIRTNLSTASIWSLVDTKLTKPFELNIETSYLQMVVLWKSNTSIKLQILNFETEALDKHSWVEASNKSLPDILDNDILGDNFEQSLLDLKAHYTPAIYEEAQRILSANGIIFVPSQQNNDEYLSNLESILKDLKKHHDEPSSLTLYNGEVVMVNTLYLYNHFVYKINSKLESFYYNLTSENEATQDDLLTYLQVVNGFVSTLSSETLQRTSRKLCGLVTGELQGNMPLKDKFTAIFKECLESQFQVSNLKKLYDRLTSLDIMTLLKSFIENHLQNSLLTPTLIDSMSFDNFSSVALLESVYQCVLIENKFIVDTLLIFTLMDFNYSMFEKQLNFLLKTHYNQSLWLQLYRLDKSLLISEIFVATSKYGYGPKISSYADLSAATKRIVTYIAEAPLLENPFLIAPYNKWIIHPKNNSTVRNPSFFLDTIHTQFYVRENTVHQFMLGLSYYRCGRYEEAYSYLSRAETAAIKPKQLPLCLQLITKAANHPWQSIISDLGVEPQAAGYYYNLSKLFSNVMSYSYALQSIKKSIALSQEVSPSTEFRILQLTQFMDTLIIFDEFEEVLDVLTLEQETLGRDIRTSYYERLLSDQQLRDRFITTLFRLCSTSCEKLYLNLDDFLIIDSLLRSQLDASMWDTYKRLFCYRILNHHEREAAEVLYEYIGRGNDPIVKEKCYWMIVNVLASLSPQDQWIINSSNRGQVVYLADIRKDLQALTA
ncbi:ABR073Cp [Eremothecium gossypii ATCC 10895]|uniref:ABR073Cp n=1 Tax=Eremothecium gossypii (strain ATCC 10895 / CBS 109.51 / FGSC 9923 / NRRL Y-1056) TaxID=284811 RepID=Q75DF3_EREGS|nr:ABR073Cp [Eremothecium gossypii ATCC 10895]AAS50843.2 ABR073Cp [Eremothecium gossypii ATCC 10895]AEY95132.1 FABR073Cp [Eremothecium gossypii FDAG1]